MLSFKNGVLPNTHTAFMFKNVSDPFPSENIGNAMELRHKTLIPHVKESGLWMNFKESIEAKETEIYPHNVKQRNRGNVVKLDLWF